MNVKHNLTIRDGKLFLNDTMEIEGVWNFNGKYEVRPSLSISTKSRNGYCGTIWVSNITDPEIKEFIKTLPILREGIVSFKKSE
jgi:hypothetical protein